MIEVKHVIALFLLLSFSSMAVAQPSVRFPSSVSLSNEGVTYRAFDLGNFRALLVMDADLTAALAELEVLHAQVSELTQATEAQTQAVTLLEANVSTLTAERDRLLLNWQELDEQFQDCNAKPGVSPFLISALVASLLVSTGLVTYVVLRK